MVIHDQLAQALARGDRFSAETLRLILARAERLASGRSLALHHIAGAAWAVKEHFSLELSLLAQGGALTGAGADSAIGELCVCEELLRALTCRS